MIRKKLDTPPTQPQPVVKHQPVLVSPATTQSKLPVFWLDFPATRLRRDLTHQLHKHQIVIEPIVGNLPLTLPKPSFITRDQRAHRRLTWIQRWDRNAITDAVAHWQIKLFGISSAVLDWLSSLKPEPAAMI